MYKGEISRAAYDQHPGERWSRLKNLRKSALHYQHALKHGTASGWIDHHRPGPPGFCFHRGEMTMKTFLYPSSMPHGVGGGK